MSNIVICIHQTPVIEWYVIRCGSKDGYAEDICKKRIGLCAQIITTFQESIHCNLLNITHVATKVLMILRRIVVLTWMQDNKELV